MLFPPSSMTVADDSGVEVRGNKIRVVRAVGTTVSESGNRVRQA